MSTASNNINFAVQAGADRFSNENYLFAPSELQFQREATVQGGQFPGTII